MGFPEYPRDAVLKFFVPTATTSTSDSTSSDNSGLASNDEPDDLGEGLKPGDLHYRAYVGPPDRYDLVAAMTFNLLTDTWSSPTHRAARCWVRLTSHRQTTDSLS